MRFPVLLLLVASGIGPVFGQEILTAGLLGCNNPPAIDPGKDFLGNFNNSCYALPFSASSGRSHAGDLNAKYGLIYYKVTPGYELILTGTFANARFFSVTVYDSHLAETSGMLDQAIQPLNHSMENPFLPGVSYKANQQYGITVGFGGPVPASPNAGCSTADTTIDANFLDASQIHQGLSWNGYPGLPPGFPVHLTGPSSGGQIIIRSYFDLTNEPDPVVIVRDLTTGCGVPLKDAKNIVTTNLRAGGQWGDQAQTSAHDQFSYSIQQNQCFPQDPLNQVRWNRSPAYVPGDNSAAGYLGFNLSQTKVQSIIAGKQFMRFRFQLPALPDTPCANGQCALTGSEQLRYRSISFEDSKKTLLSVKDSDLVRDPNGNVNLIVGFGTAPPAYVTAANYYTYVDLSSAPKFRDLNAVTMRDILPGAGFQCSDFNVPFLYTEYNPEGGYMGAYVPTVDFPASSQIPMTPVPVTRANSCLAAVTQVPVTCTTQ